MEANRREMSCAQVVAELHTTVWNRGDYAAIEWLVAHCYVIHSDPGDAWDGQALDRETYRARVEYLRKAFPDLEFVIHDSITEGNRVAVRWSAAGTHLGDLRELPATRKRLTFRGQTTYELQEGYVAGHWQVVDRLGFVEQLHPPPGVGEYACGTPVTPRAPEQQRYLDVTEEAGRAFFRRGIAGGVVMLNLLRFRAHADYSATPELAPPEPIEGAAAYQKYIAHTLPLLRKSGGDVLFLGRGGPFLIGPPNERWDAALLVRQHSVAAFMAFASDRENLAGLGHRTAALEDSRLLPLLDEAERP